MSAATGSTNDYIITGCAASAEETGMRIMPSNLYADSSRMLDSENLKMAVKSLVNSFWYDVFGHNRAK